jgi:hypothetical protein
LRLPEVHAGDAERPSSISHREWHACFRRIGELTSPYDDYYWDVTDPFRVSAGQPGVAVGDLSDDLADIWRDLKEELVSLEAGVPAEDVVWHWRFGFWSHWGQRVVNAMRVLWLHITEDSLPGEP